MSFLKKKVDFVNNEPVISGFINASVNKKDDLKFISVPLPPEPKPEPKPLPVVEKLSADDQKRISEIMSKVSFFNDNYRGIFSKEKTEFAESVCFELNLLFGILSEIRLLREDINKINN